MNAIVTADASDEDEKSPEFAFEKFATFDDYGKSLERRLFGEEPQFSAVFAIDSPIRNFWLNLKGAMNGPNHKKVCDCMKSRRSKFRITSSNE